MATAVKKERDQDSRTAELEALFMSIGDGVIVTDSTARISRVNDKAVEILGFDHEELIGQWFPKAIAAVDTTGKQLAINERPISMAIISGKAISDRVYYLRKDGSQVPVSLTVAPVIMGNKPVGAIEVFSDISGAVELERSKDEFVAIASHQLRTPATAVKQYLGLLLQGYAEPLAKTQKSFLKLAYASNERQLKIADELLKVTQLDLDKMRLDLKQRDIAQIVKDSISSLDDIFKSKKQMVELKTPKRPLVIKVDEQQIKAVIENLLENASNYSREGKKVSVKIKKLTSKEGGVCISVADQGVGISDKDFPRLFKKFSRVRNSLSDTVTGTGLGLYFCMKVVNLHGGYLKVKSAAGKGSEFSIVLPKKLTVSKT